MKECWIRMNEIRWDVFLRLWNRQCIGLLHGGRGKCQRPLWLKWRNRGKSDQQSAISAMKHRNTDTILPEMSRLCREQYGRSVGHSRTEMRWDAWSDAKICKICKVLCKVASGGVKLIKQLRVKCYGSAMRVLPRWPALLCCGSSFEVQGLGHRGR